MQSCIFEGRVKHTRTAPVLHRFVYRIFFMYLDLAELETVFRGRWFWSTKRAALARLRRCDHLGPAGQTLEDSVRELVAAETGVRPEGPIRLLTHLSYFGYCFNPVSFYYCFDAADSRVETIVAEVNNTPWGERQCYVLPDDSNIGDSRTRRHHPEKKMHVSPFMQMDIDYDWCFSEPADDLKVYMANARDGKRFFDASINLKRTEISGPALARVLVQFPLMTMHVVFGIYWQALRLWVKRAPFYPHPAKQSAVVSQPVEPRVEQ